jgi:exodeoxyribonuclease VII small subunit
MSSDPQQQPFEKSFERLEQILAAMNSGNIPLEESLRLFEEAEKLIQSCSARLAAAEQKIEVLVKGRDGGAPKAEPFARVERSSPASTDIPF